MQFKVCGSLYFFCHQLCPINHFLKALNKETFSCSLALCHDGDAAGWGPHPYPMCSGTMGILPPLCVWGLGRGTALSSQSRKHVPVVTSLTEQQPGPAVGQDTKHTVAMTMLTWGAKSQPQRRGTSTQACMVPTSGLFSCAGISTGSWHGFLARASSTGCLRWLCWTPTPMAASR